MKQLIILCDRSKNFTGQKIKTIADNELKSIGEHEAGFNISGRKTGTCLVQLNTEVIDMNEKDFIFLEHARAGIFNIFTALLCQPEKDLVEKNDIFHTLKSALSIVNPDYSKIVDQMQKAAQQNTVQELLVEYTKLFIGPFKTLVPPYSSLYFGNDTLMSDQTVWVINFYKKSGLEFNEKIRDVPDHVAVETEFMYFLIHNEIKELDAGNRDKSFSLWENQQEFFEKHYKKWVPEFCAKMATETNNEYFKVLSECLNTFINDVEIPAFPN